MASGGNDTGQFSDEIFDFVCTMCKRKDRNREAKRFCVDCNDFYCLTCVKVHDDVPSLTGHKIVQQGQFPQKSAPAPPVVPTERCDRHPHKLVDMYCQNHDDVCCAICMTAEHKSCQDIFYIPEFIKNNTNLVSPDIHKKLASTAKSLSQNHDFFQRAKQSLLERKTVSLENIRKFRKEINDRFDELEKVCVSDIENRFKILAENLEEAENLLQANKARVKSAQDNIAAAGSNMAPVFVSLKIGRNVAQTAEKCVEEDEVFTKMEDIKFEANQRISAFLKEKKSLGRMITTSVVNLQKGVLNFTTEPFASGDITLEQEASYSYTEGDDAGRDVEEETALLQIRGRKTHSIRIPSDERACHITGVCVLVDGTFVLCDQSNRNLKCLDGNTYNVRRHCDLAAAPWQVCPINSQTVAVSLGTSKEIKLISVAQMRKTNHIETEHGCYGLAYNNGNLYISDRHTSIYIYTLSGRKLKQFNIDLLKSRSTGIFSIFLIYVMSIVVSADGSKIYVTHEGNGLIILDNNGQVVAHYNSDELRDARNCYYLTRREGVLVCGNGSNNILQIGSDGHLIGEVLKSDSESKGCRAVCCDQQMSKMIVARSSRDYIEVYDLS